MANLFFPQLTTGAMAQYPIRKTTFTRSIRNVLPDGSLQLAPDSDAAHMLWQLSYQALSSGEVSLITTHFNACLGRFRGFTFIDPTDNMLLNSANLNATSWVAPAGLSIAASVADPVGGNAAFLVTNNSQVSAKLSQTLTVPADYQYCFSVYATSAGAGSVDLVRTGLSTEQSDTLAIGPGWGRISSSGKLSDTGIGFTVSIRLSPGQQITIYGPQLEAQITPSRYRSTLTRSGIYTDAHWAVDAIPVIADAPDQYSTIFTIEAAI